ncbi:MAG: Nif11-like leader peptide family RiPP precursor [Chlorobiaceae bacterium]
MSTEQAKEFLARMKNDERFMEAVIGIEDVETRMEYIRREGFDVTDNEIRQEFEAAKKADAQAYEESPPPPAVLPDRLSQPSRAGRPIDLMPSVLSRDSESRLIAGI